MTFAVRLLAAFLTAAVLLVVGCDGDEGESPSASTPSPETTGTSVPSPLTTATTTPTTSPSPSPAPTPSPSPEPEVPSAAPIELESGVESLAENTLLAVLQPQASHHLDPVALAEGHQITPLPCAALVFYLSWQLRNVPQTDIDVEVYWMRMDGKDLIGEGPSGQASGGCGEFQVVNNSDVWATVEIRYVIGELTD